MNELHDYKEYLKHTLTLKGSTEYAVFIIFDTDCYSKLPLDELLWSFPQPVSFIYGDTDWMRRIGTHHVLEYHPACK